MLKLKITLWLFLLLMMWYSLAMEPIDFARNVWANENLIKELDDACNTAKDKKHCFGIWLAISNAESWMWKANSSHWYFGRVASKDKSAYWFVATYNKNYSIPSKYNEWGLFYWYWPNKPAPTSYCLSETSSNSKGHCPNGRASFNKIYLVYKKDVMGTNTIIPPLSERITQPATIESPKYETKKIKKICRRVGTVKEWEYIQLDDLVGRFVAWYKWLKPSKVFICKDI